MEAEDGAGDDSERAESTSDEFGQVVPGDVLHDFAAAGGECAVGKGDGDADDEIAQRAETKAEHAGIVGRKNAADGCGFWREDVDGEALTVLRQCLLKTSDGAARFDGYGHIGPGMFENF